MGKNTYYLNQLDVFLSSISKKEITIVVIPQIHLSPYVYSLLLKERAFLNGNIVIIHTMQYEMSFDLFDGFNNIFQIDIRCAHSKELDFAKDLFNLINKYNCIINRFILHNFAGSINKHFSLLGNISIGNSTPEFVFYADGSRNNPNSEDKSQTENGFCYLKEKFRFYYFGFVHPTNTLDNDKYEVIPYKYIDSAFKSLGRYSVVKECLNTKENAALVLTRYWGRSPYFFNDSIPLHRLMVLSIKKILKNKNLVVRNDSRFDLEEQEFMATLKDSGFNPCLFDELFMMERSVAKRLLFENFIIDNPNLLDCFDEIYCFDSSFPLIFVNSFFYSLLPENVKIYIGFDKELVHGYGVGDCYSVMKKRIIETVQSVSLTKRFLISDSTGLFFCAAVDKPLEYSQIEKQFEKNKGYFVLTK